MRAAGLSFSTRLSVVALVSLVVVTALVTVTVSLQDDDVVMAGAGQTSTTSIPEDGPSVEVATARAQAVDSIGAWSSAFGQIRAEPRLIDALVNRVYEFADGRVAPLTAGIAVGRVATVERGVALAGTRADEVDFDSPDAFARIAVLTIDPDEAWGTNAGAESVRVALKLPPSTDFAEFAENLKRVGTVVVFSGQSGGFDFDEALPAVRYEGEMLGFVDDDGTIDFPLLEDAVDDPQEYLAGVETLDDLIAESNRSDLPVRHIEELEGP